MATEPPVNPQPPPTGSREEWREWRRQMRLHYGPGPWGWGRRWTWFWGIALILVGAYYLLKNLGLLEWVKGDFIWPLLLILLGVWLLLSRLLR